MPDDDDRVLKLIAFALVAARDAILDVDPQQYPGLYGQLLAEQFARIKELAYDQPDLLAGLLEFLDEMKGFTGSFASARAAYDYSRRRELYESRLQTLMADPRKITKRDDAPGDR